jgi:dethiobiotin synthetase
VRSLVLLGTDTGVGKTTLAVGLLRLAADRGLRLAPFKPVESGTPPTPSPSDADSDGSRLRDASRLPELDLGDVTPYRLSRPISPNLAARLEGRVVSTSYILSRAARLLERYPALLIEPAGGLLSPYSRSGTPASLARTLGQRFPLDILLVTPNRLGAINQSALASLALQHFGLPCVGVVLVDITGQPDPSKDSNASEIAAATGLPVLGHLPFISPMTSPMVPPMVLPALPPTLAPSPISAHTIAGVVRANIDLGPLLSGALVDGRSRTS